MKKTLSLLIIATLLLGLCGCNNNPNGTQNDKINIVATIFPQYDFARQITNGEASINLLLTPGSESHTYEPTPKDIIRIQDSDVFIYIGGESDQWVDNILQGIDTSRTTIVKLMDYVDITPEEQIGTDDDHHPETGDDIEYDEHIWTSPKNAIKLTRAISDAICKADGKNADTYKTNTDNYIKELTNLDNEFTEIVKNGTRDTVVFGDRFPFLYFTKEYNLKHYAAFPGCSSETEPSASTMATLIDEVTNNSIPVIFYVELSNQKVADTLCESTGAAKLLFHSCHNVSKDEFNSGATYISLMRANAENLKTALS
ncbi:MAG TPA: zinc ABC transporter substrate-binding protein [Clostridiales bacterium]|nr:zinc ABC transporter substrate-binding protein [Clostridiales bacterium]